MFRAQSSPSLAVAQDGHL